MKYEIYLMKDDYKKYETLIAKMLKIAASKQVAKNSNHVILLINRVARCE